MVLWLQVSRSPGCCVLWGSQCKQCNISDEYSVSYLEYLTS